MKLTTKNEQETKRLAARLVARFHGGQILGLVGDLGAGKTTFVQGLARALRVKARVASPTFVLLKIYQTKHPIIKRLVHLDAYRLTNGSDLTAIGWRDYCDQDSLVVVEWADKIKRLLPPAAKIIKFTVRADGRRLVEW